MRLHQIFTRRPSFRLALPLLSSIYHPELVGQLLKALEESPYADNIIVVIWSDHGWRLGEKEHWRKFALWANVIRTVMMIKVPKALMSCITWMMTPKSP